MCAGLQLKSWITDNVQIWLHYVLMLNISVGKGVRIWYKVIIP